MTRMSLLSKLECKRDRMPLSVTRCACVSVTHSLMKSVIRTHVTGDDGSPQSDRKTWRVSCIRRSGVTTHAPLFSAVVFACEERDHYHEHAIIIVVVFLADVKIPILLLNETSTSTVALHQEKKGLRAANKRAVIESECRHERYTSSSVFITIIMRTMMSRVSIVYLLDPCF